MSAATSGTSGEDLWQPKVNPWIIAGAVSLAAFMEVLDTSIANQTEFLRSTEPDTQPQDVLTPGRRLNFAHATRQKERRVTT